MITRDKPHLILLDEPTNHLDVDSRQALVQAINSYDGAVVLVSHDTHLLEACADRLWLVENGKVQNFQGDLADYRRHLAAQKRHANPDAVSTPLSCRLTPASPIRRRRDAALPRDVKLSHL